MPDSAAELRSLYHIAGETPVRQGLANHRYSALERVGQPTLLSVGGGASGPKAGAEGVEPRNTINGKADDFVRLEGNILETEKAR